MRSKDSCLDNQPVPPRHHGNSLFENLLTYKEAARYLKVSVPYLRRLKAQGSIPHVQIGSRQIRFKISSLDKWIIEREVS